MQQSDIPTKVSVLWGASAGGGYIRSIPIASQIGIQNGAASFTDGFPPLNFLPVGSGGVPPFGQDMNGILNQETAWTRWQGAGAFPLYDATFQTNVGGYPIGSVVGSLTTPNLYWLSIADNNVTNPDAGGAGWVTFFRSTPAGNITFYVRTDGSDNNNGLTNSAGGAFLTLQGGWNKISGLYNFNGFAVTMTLALAGTYAGINFGGNSSFGTLTVGGSGNTYIISDVTINSTTRACVYSTLANVKLSNLELSYSYSGAALNIEAAAITVGPGTSLFLTTVTSLLGSTRAGYADFQAANGAALVLNTAIGVTGGFSRFAVISADGGAQVGASASPAINCGAGITVTSGFVVMQDLSQCNLGASTTFPGSSVTGPRYNINSNSVFRQGGVTYPGSSSGVTSTGGQAL